MTCSLKGLYAGGMEEAWAAAADLSSWVHIKTVKRNPTVLVIGRAPEMYDEIWTAGKVMYKLEQVVADQGKLIIYAPHVREISRTWGARDREARIPHERLFPLTDGRMQGGLPEGCSHTSPM